MLKLCGKIVILYLFSILSSYGRTYPILWNMERLDAVRTNPSYKVFIDNNRRKADYYLVAKPIAVTDKSQCVSGNKHNYESLSSYYWPDETNPDGPYVSRDGVLNPKVNQYDRVKIDTCALRLRTLAQVYYWTGNEKYYKAFRKQLRCWFIDSSTKMLPNMDYGQVIKGMNGNKGNPHGIIDIFPLVEILESVRLVDSSHGIDYFTMKKMKKWSKEMLVWLQTSELGIKESKQPNNHSTAYDELCLALASFCDDKEACDSLISEYADKRINAQINDDGVLTGETWRTRAYMYSIQNLSHIVDFCIMAQNLGSPIYEANAKSINQCFSYLTSYIGNQSEYPYQEMGNWKNLEDELKLEIDRMNRVKGSKGLLQSLPDYKVNYFNASAKYSK